MRVAMLEREIKRNKETTEVDAGDELWQRRGRDMPGGRCTFGPLFAIIE